MVASHVQFSFHDDLMHFDERHFRVINKDTVSKWFGLIKKINFLDYTSIKYFSLQNFSQITSPAFDLKTQQLMSVCLSQVANLDIWFDTTHMGMHGLLYKWTELLYLTCPHEADLLTLIMSQKPTQYL